MGADPSSGFARGSWSQGVFIEHGSSPQSAMKTRCFVRLVTLSRRSPEACVDLNGLLGCWEG
jgi:hypothetical protein